MLSYTKFHNFLFFLFLDPEVKREVLKTILKTTEQNVQRTNAERSAEETSCPSIPTEVPVAIAGCSNAEASSCSVSEVAKVKNMNYGYNLLKNILEFFFK